jgi:hypothetical protein
MYFQPFLREILPVLKCILPLEHYVIPYPADTPHPALMPDREDLSFRENCNRKKKERRLVNSAPLRSTPTLFQLTVLSCCLIKVSQAWRGIVICLQIREVKLFTWKSTFTT